jgi:hypothetical protein
MSSPEQGPAAPPAGGEAKTKPVPEAGNGAKAPTLAGRLALPVLVAALAGPLLAGAFAPSLFDNLWSDWSERLGYARRGGLLFIEPPQVYTRERLVNDRFAQANWLTRELESTDKVNDAERAAAVSRVLTRSERSEVSASVAEPEGKGAADDASARDAEAPSNQVRLDRDHELERRLNYRNIIRSELMDTQLDDSHDLDGNTLYRFNFDAVVMPWADIRSYPGSAVFFITAKLPAQEQNAEGAVAMQEAMDNVELLRSWSRQTRQYFTQVIKYRSRLPSSPAPDDNKADPNEDAYLSLFLKKTLFEAYADLLSANIVKACAGDKLCSEYRPGPHGSLSIWSPKATLGDGNSKQEIRQERRERIASELNVGYRDNEIVFPEALEAALSRALLRANDVNVIQWRRSRDAFVPGCMASGPAGAGGNSGPSNAPNSETNPTARDESELYCLKPYYDPGYVRAMIRLISVTEALVEASVDNETPLAPISFDDKYSFPERNTFTGLQDKLNTIMPDEKQFDLFRAEVKRTTPAPDLPPVLQRLQAQCGDIGNPRTADIKGQKDILETGTCLFLRYSMDNVDNIMTRFIHERVARSNVVFGETSVPIIRFVEVKMTGCGLVPCQMEVQLKSRDDVKCGDAKCYVTASTVDQATATKCNDMAVSMYNDFYRPTDGAEPSGGMKDFPKSEKSREMVKGLFKECITAYDLMSWLERGRNGLALYEISPHDAGPVARLQQGGSVSARLNAQWNGSAGTLKQSQQQQDTTIGIATDVIGFGQIAGRTTDNGAETNFGWILRPTRSVDGQWAPRHYRLSAVLSVPSWQKRLTFSIDACWVTPDEARRIGFDRVDHPQDICRAPPPVQVQAKPGSSTGQELQQQSTASRAGFIEGVQNGAPAENDRPTMHREYVAELPRRVEEVTEKFRFDFIKAPYLDPAWLEQPKKDLALEAGRSGKLVIMGARLWRGTVVTVGGQPADKITVLPDMKGVVAEYDCVMPPPGMVGGGSGTSNTAAVPISPQPARPAEDAKAARPTVPISANMTVWTSEGRTTPQYVDIYRFEPRYKGEQPCDPRRRTPPMEQAVAQ